MVDAHVHLEKGDYTVEWVQQFVDYAVQRNINEIFFLEHTHIFRECRSLYDEMSSYNEYQRDWYQKKWERARPLSEYIDFIEKLKRHEFSVRLKFGLEVCYSPEHEKDISEIGRMYPFDFLVGSIHFIDGWAFSHLRQRWDKKDHDADALYKRYYEVMQSLVDCGLFSGLAHPQSLQCYGAYPQKNYKTTYLRLAKALSLNNMYIEESSGLTVHYGDRRLGMNPDMLACMLAGNVKVLTASDAHVPQDVGRYVKEMNNIIKQGALWNGQDCFDA